MAKKVPKQQIQDAERLYVKCRGRNLEAMVEEMHALGWTSFTTAKLYKKGDSPTNNWVERFGWNDLLEDADRNFIIDKRIGKRFRHWLEQVSPEMNWRWDYQRLVYRKLYAIHERKSRRVMVFLPPRHGKSELVTVRYAVWRLERDPKTRIIIGSYNQKLANRFSRKIREIVKARIAAIKASGKTAGKGERLALSRHKAAADEWETTAGGGVKAVGVGAGVTGFGADLVIIDDPIKSRSEAESENNRERVWEWFTDDLQTRLEPGGAIILIQTRWHEDDLAGRLLKTVHDPKSNVQSEGAAKDKWDVLLLPALAEEGDELDRSPGDALCPERFDRASLLEKQRNMGSYSFAALYQQNPMPRSGGLFKREWFSRVVDEVPKGLRWCRGYDLAVSTKTSADFTASFRCAIDREGNLYIADGFKRRVEYPEQRRYIVGRLEAEKDTEHGIELALHGEAFVQEIRRETRFCGRAIRGVRVTADKFTRALAWANRAEAGKVILVRGAWNEEFLEEVCRFPNGRHDDQVDAVSLAVQMIGERRKYAYGF